MNLWIMFLPIILVVIAIALVGLLMSKFRIWKPKRTLYFFIAYAICGLAAYIFISFTSNDMNRAVSEETIRQQQTENEQMIERLQLRDYTVLKDQHLKFTKTFEPTEEDVTVNRDEELRGINTVINWVNTDESVITASYYETPMYTDRIPINSYVKQPTITFENNTIFIKDTEYRLKVKLVSLSLEMLDDESWTSKRDGFVGNRILYLNVPKHFNIIDSGGGWY